MCVLSHTSVGPRPGKVAVMSQVCCKTAAAPCAQKVASHAVFAIREDVGFKCRGADHAVLCARTRSEAFYTEGES
jgi:hypothetical protein